MGRKEYFSLPPVNDTSSGFSYSSSNSIVKFQIPAQETFLETATLRLTGQVQFKDTSTTTIDPSSTDYDAIHYNADFATFQTLASNVCYASFGGVKTFIDRVLIETKKSRVELASVNNYSQYVSVREPRIGTVTDFRNSPMCRSLSMGTNAVLGQRRSIISDTVTDSNRVGQEFTIKLDIDLLQNNLLNLSEESLGGLVITLFLNSESSCLSTFKNGVSVYPENLISNTSYVFTNLKLEGRYIIPSSSDFSPQVVQMDSQINLLNNIYSNKSSTTFTPQAQLVKGIVNLFLLQNQTNSLVQSQYNFLQVPGLREVEQLKNSSRLPVKFPLKSVPNYQTPNAIPCTNYMFKSLATNSSEVRLLFERSLLNGYLPKHTSATLGLTEGALSSIDLATAADDESSNLLVDSQGVGVDYTFGMGMKQNYKNQNYNLQLSSGVNSQNANILVNLGNQGILQQTFVRATSELDQVSLVRVI